MALAQMAPDNRPPNVEFSETMVEDRDASIKAGRLVMKSTHTVTVRQIGSRDAIEFQAHEWLTQQDRLAEMGRCPAEWASFYRKKYDAFVSGMEGPVNGFPIRDWPSVNRAMAATIIAAGINSVEDLAAANESALQVIGMGSRGLRDKARAWLDSTNKINPEELAALRAESKTKDDQIKALEDRIAAIEAAKAKKA